MDYTPALSGAITAGGVWVASKLKGRGASLMDLGTALVIGAGAAYVAPDVAKNLMSPGALQESAASSAVAWAVVWAINDTDSANPFLVIQFGSHLIARTLAQYIHANNVATAAEDSEAYLKETRKAVPTTVVPLAEPFFNYVPPEMPMFDEKKLMENALSARQFKSPF